MQDRIRKVLLALLMQPKWSGETGFAWGRSDEADEAADEAHDMGLIERYDEGFFVEYRLTDKGKEYLNADS